MLLNDSNLHVGGLVSLNVKPRAIKKLHLRKHKSTARGNRKMHGFSSEEISPKHFRLDCILKVFLLAPTLHYSGHPALASTIYLAAKLGDTDSGRSRCSLDNVLCLSITRLVNGKYPEIQQHRNESDHYCHLTTMFVVKTSSFPQPQKELVFNVYSSAMFSMILLIFASHELFCCSSRVVSTHLSYSPILLGIEHAR